MTLLAQLYGVPCPLSTEPLLQATSLRHSAAVMAVPSTAANASDSSSTATSELWKAKPGCPQHLREALERFVNDQDPAWRSPPLPKGETFDSFEQCRLRLNIWALVDGFAIVATGDGANTPMKRSACIHHGNKTRNYRKLEERVEKEQDMENNTKIVSRRQRDNTTVRQKGCQWSAYCSYKDIGKRGSGIKGYCLVIKESSHSHDLVANSLMFPDNQKLIPQYQELLGLAARHRQAVISYSQSRRILEQENFGVFLSSKSTIMLFEISNMIRKRHNLFKGFYKQWKRQDLFIISSLTES